MSKKVLVLSPHTDDFELSCGGTIHKLLEKNYEVFLITFSIAEESVPKSLPSDVLYWEQLMSAKRIGIKEENIVIYRFPVRNFNLYRQEILEILISYKNKHHFDIVFCPSSNDVHQDHEVIHNECLRAFKSTSIYGMDLPWNYFEDSFRCLSKISEKDLEAKIEALKCFKSQNFRDYFKPDYIKNFSSFRGMHFGIQYAEKFEIIRSVNHEF